MEGSGMKTIPTSGRTSTTFSVFPRQIVVWEVQSHWTEYQPGTIVGHTDVVGECRSKRAAEKLAKLLNASGKTS